LNVSICLVTVVNTLTEVEINKYISSFHWCP